MWPDIETQQTFWGELENVLQEKNINLGEAEVNASLMPSFYNQRKKAGSYFVSSYSRHLFTHDIEARILLRCVRLFVKVADADFTSGFVQG